MDKELPPELASRIAQAEAWIREGKGRLVRLGLRRLLAHSLPREALLPLARQARVAGVPQIALRLLNPIVRPGNRVRTVATEDEKAEYGGSLIRVGATREGSTLLGGLAITPTVLLYLTHAKIAEWDYEGAVPLMRRYLQFETLDPYQRVVGLVNLASALVHERKHEEAGPVLALVLDESHKGGFRFAHATTLKIAAENALLQEDWESAEHFLAKSQEEITGAGSLDELLVDKWRAILDLRRQGASAVTLRKLALVRERAMQILHWETVRDCDRFEAQATRSSALFHHLFFGTPFECYRKHLAQDFPEMLPLPEDYVWNPVGEGSRCLDVLHGRYGADGPALKRGQIVHRLLAALASDFYRPFRIADLHQALHGQSFYNPQTSPGQVKQAILRLRRWLAGADVPLSVEEENRFYRLRAARPLGIRVGAVIQEVAAYDEILEKLRQKLPSHAFSLSEAQKALSLPTRTISRALSEARADGVLVRQGRRRSAKYRFAA